MDRREVSITTARGDDAHAVCFSRRGGEIAIALARPRSDRRDALHEALRAHAACTIGGARLSLAAPITARAEGRARLSVGGAALALIDLATLAVIEARPLTPFEVRVLADTGHPARAIGEEQGAPPALVTDLHTHLAACVEPAELLSIGARAGVSYPPALLEIAGIHAGTGAPVPLSALDPHLLARLASRLAIPLDRRITFLDLERVYALRAPITKHPAALVPILGALARDYAAMGARYVELSYSAVIKAETLATIHRALPAIEAETGVTIRFLAALSRHDDLAWDLDLLDRIAEIAGSRYLVGVDFMGHETNATRAFEPQLRALAAWATERRPGFVIRVHAGESPAHPANVREVLEICAGAAVELRIGHGVHGVDARTLDAIVERGAIVEINASSNVALNNVLTFGELPAARYARAGARLALGTDGYGIYGTTLAQEARTARLAGLDDRAFAAIAEGERALIAARAAHDARAAEPAAYEVPPDRPPHHFTEAVLRQARARIEERDRALAERLSAIGVTLLDPAALDRKAAGKRVACIAGSWTNHWAILDESARSLITTALEELVRGLDPDRHLLVTGGTRHGVEGVIGPLAMARGIEVIAALVAETPPASIEPGAFSTAAILGERLYDKAACLYDWLRGRDAIALFFAGGSIVGDEIQVAKNLRLDHACLVGAGGASEAHGRADPRRAFSTGTEALARVLHGSPRALGPLFHPGANPAADAVVLRRIGPDLEVLLVRRDEDADAETGRWALPGGFIESASPPGEPFAPGPESARATMARELAEETGLRLDPDAVARALEVGAYAGGGRDPRDSERAFVTSTAFALLLDPEAASRTIAGGDDAADARWLRTDDLPDLAFDHARIVLEAIDALRRSGALDGG